MAKSFFKRGEKKPDVGAAANALVQTQEQEWANNRITPDMPLAVVVERISEHGIKVWHMPVGPSAEVIIFAGGDAPELAKRALAAIYGVEEIDDAH